MPTLLRRLPRSPYFLGALLGAGILSSCLEDVAQTAILDPNWSATNEGGQGPDEPTDLPASCLQPSESDELPPGANFGEGATLADYLFADGSYAALEGPGLFITAHDTYRIYVNGNLVAQSETAREPRFLPLSLPPGDNVIAIAVESAHETPAALVHIDELERSYSSDSDWKVSTTPEARWQEVGFDDANWTPGSVLADLGDAPGCDPESGFPESSQARWIGAPFGTKGPIALRKTISIAPLGFGASATGGDRATPLLTSTLEELLSVASSDAAKVIVIPEGHYDFRRSEADVEEEQACPVACANEPSKILHQLLTTGQTCDVELVPMQRHETIVKLGANTTLVGLGRGAYLRGLGFDFQDSENIIIRNIALYDINPSLLEAGDAFGLSAPSNVWIDHGTVKWVSDGFTDIRDGSNGITLSYMHYDGTNDAICDGQQLWTSEFTEAEVTVHHSRYDHSDTRTPYVSGSSSRVHLFNNLYANNAQWAVGSGCGAQVLLEGSTFENVAYATRLSDCAGDGELGLLRAPKGSNLYRDSSNAHSGGDGQEPHDDIFTPGYDYDLELASDAWPKVISRAGTGGPWALSIELD